MLSTGNDIVDLNAINVERTRDIKFYSKIITQFEQQLYSEQICQALSLEVFVWLAWSVKEAVYKYLKRSDPELVFSPIKITISSLEFADHFLAATAETEGIGFDSGRFYKITVHTPTNKLSVRSIIDTQFIVSIAGEAEDFESIYWGVKRIAKPDHDFQSQSARVFLLNKLSAILGTHKLSVSKSPVGYPFILKDRVDINIPVSIAHHGNFVAYSFNLSRQYQLSY